MTRERDDGLRVPPNANDAEQAVLGGLMLSPESLVKISDWLPEEAFYRRDHRMIFRAISHLVGKKEPCDPVTMAEWFGAKGLSEMIGGMSYIIELSNNTPSAANIVAYAEIVAEKWRLREAIDAGSELAGRAFESRGADSATIVSETIQKLTKLQTSKLRGGLQTTKQIVGDWYAELHRRYEAQEPLTGMPTPWRDVNEVTGGLHDGDLIMLAARPNMGKSIAAFQMAAFTALRGHGAAIFSLETTRTQILDRLAAAIAGVPFRWLKNPVDCLESESYWRRISEVTERLLAAPLLIDDQAELTVDQIRARAMRAHLRTKLRMVVTDHMHIVGREGRNEVQELGQISRGHKALAKDLGCPVLGLVQLNRKLEDRPNKRPIMSDMRSSGELEQDADVIMFLYRDEVYHPDTHLKGVAEIEIGKGRDIKTGQRIHLRERYDEMRLEDWEGDLPKPYKRDPDDDGAGGSGMARRMRKAGQSHRAGKDD